jgi:hypothetical protein
MKLATLIAAASILTVSSTARADEAEDARRAEEEFLPIALFPQIGVGLVSQDGDTAFDGSLRWSPSWKVVPRTYVGGFIEARTISFDSLDFAVGPQVQYRIGENLAVQGRAGVGAEMEGERFAVAGITLGTFLAGATVSGRRYFDDDRYEVSVNLEVTGAIVLLPLWIAATR